MISKSALNDKLKAYANTSVGKRRMRDCIQTARDSGKTLASGGNVVDKKLMLEMAYALAEMIRKRLPSSISDVGDTLSVSAPARRPDGSYKVVLNFDASALHRNSLENDLGYNGIDNIVALFNNGYHAKNYVYGWWDGHQPSGESVYRSGSTGDYAWVRGEKEREALRFMQSAEAEFNAVYASKYGVIVQLGSDYIKE